LEKVLRASHHMGVIIGLQTLRPYGAGNFVRETNVM